MHIAFGLTRISSVIHCQASAGSRRAFFDGLELSSVGNSVVY